MFALVALLAQQATRGTGTEPLMLLAVAEELVSAALSENTTKNYTNPHAG